MVDSSILMFLTFDMTLPPCSRYGLRGRDFAGPSIDESTVSGDEGRCVAPANMHTRCQIIRERKHLPASRWNKYQHRRRFAQMLRKLASRRPSRLDASNSHRSSKLDVRLCLFDAQRAVEHTNV